METTLQRILPDQYGNPCLWEKCFNGTFFCEQHPEKNLTEKEINDILGQWGPCYVIALRSNITGEIYAEVIPEPALSTADDVMFTGDFNECWVYANGYNTTD